MSRFLSQIVGNLLLNFFLGNGFGFKRISCPGLRAGDGGGDGGRDGGGDGGGDTRARTSGVGDEGAGLNITMRSHMTFAPKKV